MFDACIDFLVKNRFHLNNDKLWGGKDQKAKQERIAAEENQIDLRQETTSSFNGHEYVDLGLPSGTLWATCNVGANKPEDYGDCFSWDEGKTSAANWGNGWRMPSKEQWEELNENTKSTWTKKKGVNGRLFTANNGKSLFLPAAGGSHAPGLDSAGSNGLYWSSSLDMDDPYLAWFFCFDDSGFSSMGAFGHFLGQSVRAVREN
jgi:uncharacterized protein (TIGR02145 family)